MRQGEDFSAVREWYRPLTRGIEHGEDVDEHRNQSQVSSFFLNKST
jgi:hypothetical protein